MAKDPEAEYIRTRVTNGFIGHLEHRPDWPADHRAQHLIRQAAIDTMNHRPALYRLAVRAWHYPLGYPAAPLREAGARLIDQGKRRAARLRAREIHRADTGYTSPEEQSDRPPSGCALCGRPERYHGNVWHRSAQKFGRHVRPDNSVMLVRMQLRRARRADRGRAA